MRVMKVRYGKRVPGCGEGKFYGNKCKYYRLGDGDDAGDMEFVMGELMGVMGWGVHAEELGVEEIPVVARERYAVIRGEPAEGRVGTA